MPVLDHESLLARQRCTAQFAELAVDPIGSAGSPPGGFVLFEVPLPWPSDVLSMPELADLGAVTKAARARPQALVPDAAVGGPRRRSTDLGVIAYVPRPADGTWRGVPMVRRAGVAADVGDLATVAQRVLAEATAAAARDGGPEPAGAWPTAIDVLVCTHGTRDVCCGSVGSVRYARLCEELATHTGGSATGGPIVQLWRTSHTGGHRFAPTVLTFPDGLSWAWTDRTDVLAAAQRRLPVEEAARHLRGALTVPGPFAQVVDRAAFAAEGWSWLGEPRRVGLDEERLGEPAVTHVVEIAGRGASGAWTGYRGTVRVAREVPVPPCGVPIGEAHKFDREYELVDLVAMSS